MDSIVRNISEMNDGDRRALEHVVGRELHADQQLVIHIVNLDKHQQKSDDSALPVNGLPDWTDVYAGFSEKDIAEIEAIALQRADLTRPST
jgi:hypothetical protein